MRRESEPIYGSASASNSLNNLLHHHGHVLHGHPHHHGVQQSSHPSPSGQLSSGAVVESPLGNQPPENGTLAGSTALVDGPSEHPGLQAAFHSHLLHQQEQQHLQHHHQQQQQQQQQVEQQLHQHHRALSPTTSGGFAHGGFPGLSNGSSGGSYPGLNSFGSSLSNVNASVSGRSTNHPATSSLDEYVDILQVQQLLLENSTSVSASNGRHNSGEHNYDIPHIHHQHHHQHIHQH
ncbi:AGAP002773-PB-like protein [Anopheles sinensis]|uniref:AGAP002773-PB-like protein n=1 Tax=Anopheles sinensis TaxID=74873 RepID=A0A084W337_ANOSI|nr:AGAP002773-PB-like protein [Anopheles sinensis]